MFTPTRREILAKAFRETANARAMSEYRLMANKTTEAKSKVGRPVSDPSKKAALAENIRKIFPMGAKDLHQRLVARFGDKAPKKVETLQRIYDGDGPSVSTDVVRQIAAIISKREDELFEPGLAITSRPTSEPGGATDAALQLGDMMPEIEDAIDADPRLVAETSAALMNSELRHLHAFFTRWMHSKLKRTQGRKLHAAAELQHQE